MSDSHPDFQQRQLDNGLTVVLIPWQCAWLKANIIIHSGGREDPAEKSGTAHFLEHMMCQSTGFNPDQIKLKFKLIGGRASLGGTGYSVTVYHFAVPLESDHLEAALAVFGKLLMNAEIRQDIEAERITIINEFKSLTRQTQILADMALMRRMIFGKHPLANALLAIGQPASIKEITFDDLRDYYERHYHPANTTIVAVGGIDFDELVKSVQTSPFGLSKAGQKTSLAQLIKEFPLPEQTRLERKSSDIFKSKASRSEFLSFAAIPGTVRRSVVNRTREVLDLVLNQVIREQHHWSYYIGAEADRFQEASEFRIRGVIAWSAVDHIEEVVDRCIDAAIKRPDLIQNAIDSAVARYKIWDESGGHTLGIATCELDVYGRVRPLAERKQEAEITTIEEVADLLRSLTRERRCTLILKP